MAASLLLAAGPAALARIQREGLHAGLISSMRAASGGPKGLMLLALDRYLLAEFFPQSTQPVDVLGTSIGAWRMACYAQADPLAALARFEAFYLDQRYSAKPDREEITRECARLLAGILGEQGVVEIAANPRFRLHVIAARARGGAASENRQRLLGSMALLAASNMLSARAPFWFFDRVLFRHAQGAFPWHDSLPLSANAELHAGNIRDALMATAAIPLVLSGVRNITGAPEGIYRDGGLTDYHLAVPSAPQPGITLFPQFFPRVVPAWFDKSLSWRVPRPQDFADVLLLAPSQAFIASLPHGRIPDRQDFAAFRPDERLKYWRTVLAETQRLADELHEVLTTGRVLEVIKPLQFAAYGRVPH